MCFRLCCDPYKLTYISAIWTGVEAFLFGALNLTLILLSKCIIKPPDKPLGAGLDDFYSYYFFSEESCHERYSLNYTIPWWINDDYPIHPRPQTTDVDANLRYQITYLSLHAAWLISSFLLLYGNARKRTGFYIPWLLIAITFAIMDITIAAFFITDMTNSYDKSMDVIGPMIWGFAMYLRIFFFWFSNIGQMATVINAFCKTRHKRSKQERRRKKEEKKHRKELAEAEAKAAGEARAEAAIALRASEEARAAAAADAGLAIAAYANAASSRAEAIELAQGRRPNSPQMSPEIPGRSGFNNRAYNDHYPDQPPPYEPPPYTPPPSAPVPKEVRPFSYLNPGFRPSDSHDVEGMKKHPSPYVSGASPPSKGGSYFSAIPPTDYEEDYAEPIDSQAGALPRVNINPRQSSSSFKGPQKKSYY